MPGESGARGPQTGPGLTPAADPTAMTGLHVSSAAAKAEPVTELRLQAAGPAPSQQTGLSLSPSLRSTVVPLLSLVHPWPCPAA